MSEDTNMAEERTKRFKAIFRQILDLPDEDKAYLMGYLLVCPWVSTTYRRYRPDGEVDVRPMTEWLNDRLRYIITNCREGLKSIVTGEVKEGEGVES